MPAGLHGTNGVGTKYATMIYNSYVLPRLLYGLEALSLSKKEVQDIGAFHLRMLKNIQGLPVRTATVAVYLLTGSLPVEGLLDLKKLSLIGILARTNNETLLNLALHQTLHSKPRHNSWFAEVD